MNETDKIINEHGNLTVEIITDEIIKQIEYCENKITENKKYETSEYIKFSYTFSLMRDGLELLLGSLYRRDLSIQCRKNRDVKMEPPDANVPPSPRWEDKDATKLNIDTGAISLNDKNYYYYG